MVSSPSPGEPFGRYRIVRRIGRGGMGTVYEAVQENLGRSVALKVLLEHLSEESDFRARFQREARALAALDSPHTIQVYDHGEEAGQLFIATQLINGPDLQRLVAERGALPLPVALEVVAQVASGLADAHAVGVLHRDIKPSNVLLREGPSSVHAYLCDFGIARTEGDDHTATGGVAGTLGYMAPERHNGAPASAQTDIYALGCLLWVLITGRLPYAGNSGVQMAIAHMQQPVPQLGGATPVHSAIDAILARAMDKNPERRYRSALEMRRDLVAAAGTTSAHQPGDHQPGAHGAPTLIHERPSAGVAGTRPEELIPAARVPTVVAPRRHAGLIVGAAAGAVVAVLSGVGLAFALSGNAGTDTGDVEDSATVLSSEGQTAPPPSAPIESEGSASTEATATASDTPSPEPSASVSPTPARTPTPSQEEPTVACWDGSDASTREACGVPAGPDGLATVFPSSQGCGSIVPSVAGKVEVYECGYGDFLIRYTRWAQGYDRYGYLDAANGVDGAQWSVGGEFAGRQWTSYESGPGENQPYQWSASFRYYPYSVSVEGTSMAARKRGRAMVAVTAPSSIGLR